jgi:Ca2+-binding EF-hand superfamily protein
MPDLRRRVAAVLVAAAAGYASAMPVAAQDAMDFGIIGGEIGMSAMDFDAARTSFFYQHDRDGDFALSFAEMSDAMLHGAARLFDGYDLDGDGLITFDEYVQSGLDIFRSMDLDGDGVLSAHEM